MIPCPKCKREHRGPRPLDDLLREGTHVIALAMDCAPDYALAHLRAQWLGGALEIGGFCADCVVATIAVGMVQIEVVANGAAVRDAEEALAAAPFHLCRILPFKRPAKDAAHVGQTFDTEKKP